MSVTKFKCVQCGKLTAGRIPRSKDGQTGDLSERFPRRHKVDGKVCPGVFEFAEWIDFNTPH